jgi:hypothetical protein
VVCGLGQDCLWSHTPSMTMCCCALSQTSIVHRYTQAGPEQCMYTYIRCTYGIFSRKITIRTVIYGVYICVYTVLANPSYTLCIRGPCRLGISCPYTRRAFSSSITNSHQDLASGQACKPSDPLWFFVFSVLGSFTVLGIKGAPIP